MTIVIPIEAVSTAIKVHILDQLGPRVSGKIEKVHFVTDHDGQVEECRVTLKK